MKRIRLSVFVFLLFLSTGIIFILTTGSGLILVFKTLSAFTDKDISAENYSGSLLGGFEFNGLELIDEVMDIRITRLQADMDIAGLFAGKIDVNFLYIKDAKVTRKKISSTTVPESRSLFPSIRMKVNDLRILNLQMEDPLKSKKIIIDKLNLAFSLTGKELMLKNLQLLSEQFELAGSGRIGIDIPAMVNMRYSWKVAVNENVKVEGKTSLKGDYRRLNVLSYINRPFDGSIDLVFSNIMQEMTWVGQAELVEVDLAVLNKKLAGISAGSTLKLNGDRNNVIMDGELEIDHESIKGNLPAKAVFDITANGTIHDDNNYELNSSVKWNDLSIWFPGDADSGMLLSGNIMISVINDEYKFDSRSTFALDKLWEGSWQLQGNGDKNSVSIENLEMILAGGTINAKSNLDWSTDAVDLDVRWRNLAYPVAVN